MNTILTIAGFDPSAGAGILADIKTISAFGCYGVAAITSLTCQNTVAVYGSSSQTAAVVNGQLDPIFADFEIVAAKTGMLPDRAVIEATAAALVARRVPIIVVDPVVRSTSGFDLIDDNALAALIAHLFPLASVVTPNVPEAERIAGFSVTDEADMRRAAEKILATGPGAVLIKGGHLAGQFAADLLLDRDGCATFATERVTSTNTHGTGCTLSAAIACLLGLGYSLRDAVPIAKRYIVQAIASAPGLGHGHGPLNHFPPGFQRA